jgi:hypothetical protein
LRTNTKQLTSEMTARGKNLFKNNAICLSRLAEGALAVQGAYTEILNNRIIVLTRLITHR